MYRAIGLFDRSFQHVLDQASCRFPKVGSPSMASQPKLVATKTPRAVDPVHAVSAEGFSCSQQSIGGLVGNSDYIDTVR